MNPEVLDTGWGDLGPSTAAAATFSIETPMKMTHNFICTVSGTEILGNGGTCLRGRREGVFGAAPPPLDTRLL